MREDVEKPSKEECLAEQELEIFEYLEANCPKISHTVRDVHVENSLRKHFSIRSERNIKHLDTLSLKSPEDLKVVMTWRNQHWINFICRIIDKRVVKQIAEIKEAKHSKLFGFGNLTLTRYFSDLLRTTLACANLLISEYEINAQGLAEASRKKLSH